MGHAITIMGMVLSSMPIGEYDKRVVILSKERGKISAFAKGARKPGSQIMAAANPFSFGEFVIYEGRTSYTMSQANISNYFPELMNDLESAYYGFYFMEFADYYTKENNDEVLMLKLLYQTLRALSKNNINNELVRYIFELKAMVINGEYPRLFECVICGREVLEGIFSGLKGGVACEDCRVKIQDGIKIDPSALYAMQYIETARIEKLYTFTVSDSVLKNLKEIMNYYTSLYIDKRFKSLEILKECLR